MKKITALVFLLIFSVSLASAQQQSLELEYIGLVPNESYIPADAPLELAWVVSGDVGGVYIIYVNDLPQTKALPYLRSEKISYTYFVPSYLWGSTVKVSIWVQDFNGATEGMGLYFHAKSDPGYDTGESKLDVVAPLAIRLLRWASVLTIIAGCVLAVRRYRPEYLDGLYWVQRFEIYGDWTPIMVSAKAQSRIKIKKTDRNGKKKRPRTRYERFRSLVTSPWTPKLKGILHRE